MKGFIYGSTTAFTKHVVATALYVDDAGSSTMASVA